LRWWHIIRKTFRGNYLVIKILSSTLLQKGVFLYLLKQFLRRRWNQFVIIITVLKSGKWQRVAFGMDYYRAGLGENH
jgi:hypothetical protein